LKVQTQHAREAVGVVKQQQAHVLAMAMKAEDAVTISEQSYDKFVRENTDRIQAAADLLAKHTKAHTDMDELLLL
jgi:ABC-type Mn2+/Zn2+ transport system ATPase subunit